MAKQPKKPKKQSQKKSQKKYPKRLTDEGKKEIIKRRGGDSDKSGKKGKLEIHHKDRDSSNNNPDNLRVLTKKEHQDLHARDR